jgi:hypothetical protein
MSNARIDISALDLSATFDDREAADWQGTTYMRRYKILSVTASQYPWFEFQRDDGETCWSSSICFNYGNPATEMTRKLTACLKAANEDLEYPCGYIVRINDHGELELRKILPVIPDSPSDKLVAKV